MTNTTEPTKKKPHPYDIQVGHNLTQLRKAAGKTQTDIGNHIGKTFQQVQKYSKGKNRIGMSVAIQICQLLDCSLTDLCGGIDVKGASEAPIIDHEAAKAAKVFTKIKAPRHQRIALDVMTALSAIDNSKEGANA